MKNKYLLVIFVFISTFLINSCRQENEFIKNSKQTLNSKAKISYLSIKELPALKPSIEKAKKMLIQNKDSFFSKGITDFDLDEENIITMDFADNGRNISIIVNEPIINDQYFVLNLNIVQHDGTETYFLTKYIPDSGKPFYSYSEFIGEIQVLDLDGSLLYSNKQTTTSRQMSFILGCYGYVINDNAGYWQIQSSVCICSTCGDSGGGSIGNTDGNTGTTGNGTTAPGNPGGTSPYNGNPDGGGANGDGGNETPSVPNIPTENAVKQKLYNSFLGTLSEAQYNFLVQHSYYSNQVFYYLNDNNFSVNSKNLMNFAVHFFVQNTDANNECLISWTQFQNWFLTNIPEGFLEQIILENPATILNYEFLNSPNFKMRKLDQLKYPKFTQMVKGLKSYVQNNPIILNKLIEISGMTQTQILEKLTFGQGPQIELIPGLMYIYNNQAIPVYGKFSHNSPEVLKINENYVLGLQQASLQSTIDATNFLLAVTILHEFVHYGNFLTGFNPQGDEAGNLFENSVYGIIVTKYNANEYIISINKK